MHKKRVFLTLLALFVTLSSLSAVSAAISYGGNYPLCIGYELGTSGCTDGNAFNGYLDEVVIYNRGLTSQEAISMYGLNNPSSGLVGYWNFDSSRTPSLQNNATVVVDPAGSALDSVLLLNRTNQFAQVAYSSALQPTSAVSFGAWFKSNDYSQSQRIISSLQGGGYALVLNDPYGVCAANTLCAIVRSDNTYVTAQIPVSQLPPTAYGNWRQAIATYDGTTLRLFVQGRQVAPVPNSSSTNFTTATIVNRSAECDVRDVANKRICASGYTCQDTDNNGVGACRASSGGACLITSDCLSNSGLTCVNNRCTSGGTEATCTDSDGGLNPSIFGSVGRTPGNLTAQIDVCVGATQVNELFCSGTNVNNTIVNCSFGCSNGACVQGPSRYVTDISVRGYVGEGLRTLVLGFNASNRAELTATIDGSWTDSQALRPEQITTVLHSTTPGVIVNDSDPNAYSVRAAVVPAIYGLAASAPGNGGQATLATTGSNVAFPQFSARGYTDRSTPLIVGFTAKGDRVNIVISASPYKLPAEFTPRLEDFTYDIILYRGNEILGTTQNTLGPQLTAGMYTVVVQPREGVTGYMLLEIDSPESAMVTAQTRTNANTTSNSTTGSNTNNQNGTVACTSGCLSVNGQVCHTEGFRSGSRYCDAARKAFVDQKGEDAVCANGFECASNLCLENRCISQGLLQRLLALLRGLFGNG